MPIGWKNVAFLGFCSFLHNFFFDVFCSFWWKPRFSFVVDVGAHLHWWYGFRMNVVPRAHLVQWTPSLLPLTSLKKAIKSMTSVFFFNYWGSCSLNDLFCSIDPDFIFPYSNFKECLSIYQNKEYDYLISYIVLKYIC